MLRFHHLGIVVRNIDLAITKYTIINPFFKETTRDLVESEKVKIVLVSDGVITLEFLEPISDDSPVNKFLEDGGGMHHVCFATDNIDAYIQNNKKNIKQIREKHKGFLGYETSFFVQRNFESGISLYELVEINEM